MAITLGTPANTGNLTSSTGTTLSVTCPANSKALVVILTVYDSSATDSLPTNLKLNQAYMTKVRRYRSGSATIEIWYCMFPYIGTSSLILTMGGTNTDLQMTAVALVSTDCDMICPDGYAEGDSATTSHALVINPAKTNSIAFGGIIDQESAVTALSVTTSYGTEITGSEADMGSQVVGCAYRAASGTTAEIRWTKATAVTSSALIANFQEQHYPTTALNSPADGAIGQALRAVLSFTGTDSDSDTLEYQLQIKQNNSNWDWMSYHSSINTLNSDWGSIAINRTNGDVFASTPYSNAGKIYKQTAGTGDFVLHYTSSHTIGGILVNESTGDLWYSAPTQLYKQTGGTGAFTAYSTAFSGLYIANIDMLQSSGRIFAQCNGGVSTSWGVFELIGTTMTQVSSATGQGSYLSINQSNGDVWAGTYSGVFKQTATSGSFVLQGTVPWVDALTVNSVTGDVYYSQHINIGKMLWKIVAGTGVHVIEKITTTDVTPVGACLESRDSDGALLYGVQLNHIMFFEGAQITAASEVDTADFTSGHPFASGVQKSYTVPAAKQLTAQTVYYWRARAVDKTGSRTYGAWSAVQSFTPGTNLSGSVTTSSDVSGKLSVKMFGSSDCSSDVTGTLVGKSNTSWLTGNIAIVVAASGDALLHVHMLGTSNGTSDVTGTLHCGIMGTSDNSSNVTGSLNVRKSYLHGVVNTGCQVTSKYITDGLIYNFYAVTATGDNSLVPTGWHIATDAERVALHTWLTDNGYGYQGSGDDISKAISSKYSWGTSATDGTPGKNSETNNASGFSIRPAGYRINTGEWSGRDFANSFIWTSSEDGLHPGHGLFWQQHYNNFVPVQAYADPTVGCSARAIRDNATGWVEGDKMTDYDGNTYDTVNIGGQIWCVQNMATTHTRNGTELPNIRENSTWASMNSAAFAPQDNNWDWVFDYTRGECITGTLAAATNLHISGVIDIDVSASASLKSTLSLSGSISIDLSTTGNALIKGKLSGVVDSGCQPIGIAPNYGALYNFACGTNSKKISSSDGWRLPVWADYYTNLANYLGGNGVAGGALKETGLTHWKTPNTSAADSVGFHGCGGGSRYGSDGAFESLTMAARYMDGDSSTLNWGLAYNTAAMGFNSSGKAAISIRLVNSSSGLSNGQTGTYTGNDGIVYPTVCINGLTWLSKDLIETKYRDGSSIPLVTGNANWINLATGAMCYYDDAPSNGYSTTYSECITGTLTGKQTLGLSGAVSIDVAVVGNAQVALPTNLSGAINIDLSATGTVSGKAPLSGAINIDLTPAASLKSLANLTGNLNIDLTPTAQLAGKGFLSGAISIDLSATGSASGKAGLSGAININVTPSGDANLKGNLSGTVDSGCQPLGKTVKYGTLYNWYAATDVRDIAPAGWHVPAGSDFWNLMRYIDPDGNLATNTAAYELKETGTTHWGLNTGTDNYGFKARGSGGRFEAGAAYFFSGIMGNAAYWMNQSKDALSAWIMRIHDNSDHLYVSVYQYGDWYGVSFPKKHGLSIRLIKDDSVNTGTMTDFDGNVYPTVTIGTQVWMAENLIVEHYNDGSEIPNVTDNTAWAALSTGAMCFYNNDLINAYYANYTECIQGTLTGKETLGLSGAINIDVTPSGAADVVQGTNLSGTIIIDLDLEGTAKVSLSLTGTINIDLDLSGDAGLKGNLSGTVDSGCQPLGKTSKYGLLYNWYAATDARGIAPAGWHVPTETEIFNLREYAGGQTIAGKKLKEAGLIHWIVSNTGTNDYGFSAIGSGTRNTSGVFTGLGAGFSMVSSYSNGVNFTAVGRMYSSTDTMDYSTTFTKLAGYSIRLIKNDSTDPGTVTDYDGNVYNTVKIGTQVWMTTNLMVTHYNDGSVIPNITNDTVWAGLSTGASCAYNNDPTLAYFNNYTECITGTLSAKQTLDLSGSLNIDLTPSGNAQLTAPTNLSGSISIDVQVAGISKVNSRLSGAININVTPTGTAGTKGKLSGVVESGCQPLGKTSNYGNLYNWYVGVDARGVAPSGWHVPTRADWEALSATLGGNSVAGGHLKEDGTEHWTQDNADNSSGLSLKGSGMRGSGYDLSIGTHWRSFTTQNLGSWGGMVDVQDTTTILMFDSGSKFFGFSLRLIKNDSSNPGTVTDYDGNVYPTVKIGNQVWTQKDLIVEHYNNGDVIPNITNYTTWEGLTSGATCYYNNIQSNAYYANYTECITGTLTGKQTLGLSGSINIDLSLTGSAAALAPTDLRGNITITVTPEGTEKLNERLSGAITIDVALPSRDAITKKRLIGTVDSGCQPLGKTSKYGLLYNGYVAIDAKGVAPTGWHVPTKTEWETLVTELGGLTTAGSHLKEDGTIYWLSDNADNSSGFSARGSGYRFVNSGTGTFINNTTQTFFATSSLEFAGWLWNISLTASGANVVINSNVIQNGRCIRLIKNDSTNLGSVTDYDGNIYNTVKIGNQVWMKENLIVTHYNDGTEIPNVTDNTAWANLSTGGLSAYNNDPTNAYYDSYTECITGTLIGKQSLGLSGAINIDVTPVGSVKIQADISGAIVIDVIPVGSIKSQANLSGAITITVTPLAQTSGAGSLQGEIIIDLSANASLHGTGSLSSSILITVIPSAILKARESLSGAINIDLSPVGNVSGSTHGSGAIIIGVEVIGWAIIDSILVGESNGITITTGTLKGAGLMIGEIIIDVTPEGISRILSLTTGTIYINLSLPSANLGGYYGMSGQIIISVGIDGVTRLLSALNGLLGIDLDTSGLILGFANIDGILELDVGLSGNPAALYSINGGIFIDLDLDGEITPLARRRILLIS